MARESAWAPAAPSVTVVTCWVPDGGTGDLGGFPAVALLAGSSGGRPPAAVLAATAAAAALGFSWGCFLKMGLRPLGFRVAEDAEPLASGLKGGVEAADVRCCCWGGWDVLWSAAIDASEGSSDMVAPDGT